MLIAANAPAQADMIARRLFHSMYAEQPYPQHRKANSFAVRFLTLAVVAAGVALLWFGYDSYTYYQQFHLLSKSGLEVNKLIGEIVHLDEVLTMSACMAVATGEEDWERRYLSFEPRLDSVLGRLIQLAPLFVEPSLVSQTQTANTRLVESEHNAFALLKDGKASAAMEILMHDRYKEHKILYRTSMLLLASKLDAAVTEMLETSRQNVFVRASLVLAVLLFLLLSWLAIFRNSRKEQHLLRRNNLALQEMAAELKKRSEELASEVEQRERSESMFRRMTASRERKNKELELQLHIASHNLRSPLVNIIGFGRELELTCSKISNLIDNTEVNKEFRSECNATLKDVPTALSYIQSSTAKMNQILDGLLRLSRLGRNPIVKESLNMNAMIREILLGMQYRINLQGVCVEVSDLPSCLGDAVQINQVFSNVLDNALKYLDPDRPGLIRVSGERRKGTAYFTISDNGIGISPEDREKIFTIFHRVASESRVSGEGLGLTIVRRILDRHEGDIEVRSNEGGGSVFAISLPAADELDREEFVSESETMLELAVN